MPINRYSVLYFVCAISMSTFAFRFYSSLSRMSNLLSADFEVCGRVQGVFFRKCTQDKALELGIRGWCKNTPEGTVQGQIQGPAHEMDLMKEWLRKIGSSQSLIEKADFKNEKAIDDYTFKSFDIIRKSR